MVGYFKVANNGRSWDYAYLLGRKIEEKGKRCVNRGVAYLASAGIFFKDHGRRLSMSSTVSACGKAVNTCLRY